MAPERIARLWGCFNAPLQLLPILNCNDMITATKARSRSNSFCQGLGSNLNFQQYDSSKQASHGMYTLWNI